MPRITMEKAWLNSTTPHSLLLTLKGKRLPRQRRLFAVACCRRWLDEMPDPDSRRAVEVAERYAEGAAGRDELDAAYRAAQMALGRRPGPLRGVWCLAYAAQLACAPSVLKDVSAWLLRRARQLGGDHEGREKRAQSDLLRCVFGNPFRPVTIDPVWLAWQEGTVPKLAQVAYEQRQLPGGHLDPVRLGILADALEESGCADQALLAHLRGPGPHVRGCHLLDLVLDKS